MSDYYIGTLRPFWDSLYKEFPYVKQPLMESEIQEWQSRGYIDFDRFSGSMYDNRNPMPPWISGFEKRFGLKNQTYLFYRMNTLEIMPEHRDHYQTYIRLFNPKVENIYRVLVFLEDWKPGHYFEINGRGFIDWQAGDYVKWRNFLPHAAANIGIEPRYTLQITGELDEQ